MKILNTIGFMIVTLGMYLGISLLGWGLDDLPAFFADPIRLGYAVVVGLFSLVVGIQAAYAPEGIRGGRGQAEKRVTRQTVVTGLMSLYLFVLMFLLPFLARRGLAALPESAFLGWAGVLLSGAGYGLVFWSGVALGKMYSKEVTIQENHRLVTHGLYRYIRHPRYLGLLLAGVGVPLVFQTWVGLALWVLLAGVLLQRIGDEEKLMASEFRDEWAAYCARSWRLVPGVW